MNKSPQPSSSTKPGGSIAIRLLAGAAVVSFILFALWYFYWPKRRYVPNELPPVADGSEVEKGEHPLDPVLAEANAALEEIRANVRDYTCTIKKRERIDGELTPEETTFCKIRNPRPAEGDKPAVPFSVYMKFIEPPSSKDREVIWVDGQNEGKLIGHEGGVLNLITAHLDPNGPFAMMGQRYPIYELGLERLLVQLIERGERERAFEGCVVERTESVEMAGCDCEMIEIRYEEQDEKYEFNIARIYIDKARHIPVRYAAWIWPEEPGGEPLLDEEYTYLDLKTNVGLTDKDFDYTNDQYNFPQ